MAGLNPIALRVRKLRRTATWMSVSIGVAVLVMATVAPVSTASASSSDVPPPDKTALILGGTSIPTPNDYYLETVRNQYIEPTHPGQNIQYVAVTTPEESWPITGLFRLIGLGLAAVDPSVSREFVAAQFPPEGWWKLSGLFDLTANQSVQAGVADLETAMAKNGNDHLVIYGYSQGAVVANVEKRKLAAQYPAGTKAPDIDFVLGGDLNLPNGGFFARFPGLYIPILDWTFNGPAATDTQFHTVEINRQYDGFADFPLYPLNAIADLNALLGMVFVHFYGFDVSLPPDPKTSPAYQGTHGDTDYYFFETQDLPLFAPLRIVGVPEPVIDVVEPVFRVIVELGYDRSIPPWQPTPARLIPPLNPATVATDLVNAVSEGVNNAAALTGSPPPLQVPAPATSTVTSYRGADANDGNLVGSPGKVADLNVGEGISHSLSALDPFRIEPGNNQAGADGESSGPQTPPGGQQGNIPPGQFNKIFELSPGVMNPFFGVPPGQIKKIQTVPGTDPAVNNPYFGVSPGHWGINQGNLGTVIPGLQSLGSPGSTSGNT